MSIKVHAEIIFYHLGPNKFNQYYRLAIRSYPEKYSPYKFDPTKHKIEDLPENVCKSWFDIVYAIKHDKHQKINVIIYNRQPINPPSPEMLKIITEENSFGNGLIGRVRAIQLIIGGTINHSISYFQEHYKINFS